MVLTAQLKRALVSAMLGAAVISVGALGVSSARAQNGDDARAILKAMSDYVSGQKSIAATFNADIEVITPDLQKIQFDSSGQLLLRTAGHAVLLETQLPLMPGRNRLTSAVSR